MSPRVLRAHPTRSAILGLLDALSEVSPKSAADALGLRVPVVAYHFRALLDAGVIEESRRVPVRGSLEHFYTLAEREEAVA